MAYHEPELEPTWIPAPDATLRETTIRKRRSRSLAKDALDEWETVFVEQYCTNGGNAREAAKKAGYKNPSAGTEVRKRPHVAQALYERMRYEKLAAPELVNRLGQIVRSDIAQYHRIEEYEDEIAGFDADGKLTTIKVTKQRIVPDLVRAMQDDNTYPIKSVEYYRDGTIKKVTLEDRYEAIKMIGSIFGLFGKDGVGDDGRSWFERARDMGIDPRTALEEMVLVAKEWGAELPKELIEGQLKETIDESNED